MVPEMARKAKDGEDTPVEPAELDDLLPAALRIAAARGESSEQELSATLLRALRDPAFEDRLKPLLEAEGVSPELQKQYLRMLTEWRRALEGTGAATGTTADSSGEPSAPQRKPSS
jgi:hypothetical protein